MKRKINLVDHLTRTKWKRKQENGLETDSNKEWVHELAKNVHPRSMVAADKKKMVTWDNNNSDTATGRWKRLPGRISLWTSLTTVSTRRIPVAIATRTFASAAILSRTTCFTSSAPGYSWFWSLCSAYLEMEFPWSCSRGLKWNRPSITCSSVSPDATPWWTFFRQEKLFIHLSNLNQT